MTELALTIELLADAEPGSGFGTEMVNALVPRDARGRACVPASHLKGLLRERLQELARLRRWPLDPADELLGRPGSDGDDGRSARLFLSDAVLCSTPALLTVTRTALSDLGTVDARTLRTSEALPAGAELQATLRVDSPLGDALDDVLRLGLMSIEALGAGRRRGSGRCRILIAGETRTPGAILRSLDSALASRTAPAARPASSESTHPRALSPGAAVWCRLVFEADTPVCCPELPLVSTNALRSGPSVPASAVQGALLTRLDRLDSALASACWADPRFRAWPLLPCVRADERPDDLAALPTAVRVDLAHRMSKLAQGGSHDFRDAAVLPYHWIDVSEGSPLRSTDGVLRRWPDGRVELWPAQDLPRVVSAHVALNQNRTLYTVEALAPLVFSGLVALPAEAVPVLERALRADPSIQFGKARSVRGSGRLSLLPLDDAERTLSWPLTGDASGRVFVAQSPLALPDDWKIGRAEHALRRLAEESGWGTVVLEDEVILGNCARTMAACAVRFGWNRHGLGPRAAPAQNRLRARRVILPGSVLVLARPLDRPLDRLLAGLGDGREQGFGALLPHPGIASARVQARPTPPTLVSHDTAGREALALWTQAGGTQGPTPSQIAALRRQLERGPQAALDFLKRQAKDRPARVFYRWQRVLPPLEALIPRDPALTASALRVWQDLAIIHREERR